MVAIPNGCPTSTTPKECSPDKKEAQEVCEPTGGSILTRLTMCRIVNTHPVKLLRITVINLMKISLQKEENSVLYVKNDYIYSQYNV